MNFTGERLVPDQQRDDDLYHEHVVRYMFAAQVCRGRRVFDAGCGAGYGSALLLARGARSVVGIDIAPEAIAYARQHYQQAGISFSVGDAAAPDLPAGSIDLAVALEVIEHLAEPARLVQAAAAVLAENGLFVVSTPNPATYPAGNPFHVHEMDVNNFSALLQRSFPACALFEQDYTATITLRPASIDGWSDPALSGAADWTLMPATGRSPRQPDYYIAVCARGQETLQQALRGVQSIIYEPPADRWEERISDVLTMQRILDEKNRRLAEKDTHITHIEEELRRQSDWAAGLEKQLLELRRTWFVRLFGRLR